jgi:hypothetical protein
MAATTVIGAITQPEGIANDTVKPNEPKAMDMRFGGSVTASVKTNSKSSGHSETTKLIISLNTLPPPPQQLMS